MVSEVCLFEVNSVKDLISELIVLLIVLFFFPLFFSFTIFIGKLSSFFLIFDR